MGNTRGSLLQSVHNWSYRSISNIGRHHIFLRDEHQQLHVQDWAGHGAKPRASGLIPQVQVLVALVMIYLTTSHFTGLFIPGRVSILLFQGRKPFATQTEWSLKDPPQGKLSSKPFSCKAPTICKSWPFSRQAPLQEGNGALPSKIFRLVEFIPARSLELLLQAHKRPRGLGFPVLSFQHL